MKYVKFVVWVLLSSFAFFSYAIIRMIVWNPNPGMRSLYQLDVYGKTLADSAGLLLVALIAWGLWRLFYRKKALAPALPIGRADGK